MKTYVVTDWEQCIIKEESELTYEEYIELCEELHDLVNGNRGSDYEI